MFWKENNQGAELLSAYSHIGISITAGTTTDNVSHTGEVIDKEGYGSCKIVIPYNTTLSSGEGLDLTLTVQDSANNSDWNTAETLLSGVDMVSLVTGATVKDTYEYDVDLTGYSQYVKFATTVDATASGTDTYTYAVVVTLCGSDTVPCTKSE